MGNLPIPGKQYIVQNGDTFRSIAQRAYGDELNWLRIYRANMATLKSKNADVLIIGEVLFIPPDDLLTNAKNSAAIARNATKSKESLTFILDGREVPVLNCRFLRGINYMASSWVVQIAQVHDRDPKLDYSVRPFSYASSELYLGSTLVAKGKLYIVRSKLEKNSFVKTLECFTSTVDLVDSPVQEYEFSGTLKSIAQRLCNGNGFQVVFNTAVGLPFDMPTATKTETVSEVLIKLAKQRGMLVTCDEQERVVFLKANINGKPVDYLEEGKSGMLDFEVQFNGRNRFSTYSAVSWAGDGEGSYQVAKDPTVPGARQYTFIADDADEANVSITAKWHAAKAVADSLKVPFPVSDWYDSHGNLWVPNSIVTVKSPSLDISKPTKVLISDVEYFYSSEGRSSKLYIVPPWSLAGGEVEEPWV